MVVGGGSGAVVGEPSRLRRRAGNESVPFFIFFRPLFFFSLPLSDFKLKNYFYQAV
uniref:Uncharacterized protein n=1 Tax=Medicago truncatula TaxID=3880 RepID=Q1S5I1_MEDTR|nr:hypothetical protein MtrDRAFT_AC147431g63v2 [Medicago truncatula]